MNTVTYNGKSYGVIIEGSDVILQGLHENVVLKGLYDEIERDSRLKVATEFIGSDDFPEMDFDPADIDIEIEEVIEARIKKHLSDNPENTQRTEVIRHNLN